MSLRERSKITSIRAILWMKTHLHPEALGGDRRNTPRRKSDRRRENLQRFWLGFVTLCVVWGFFTIRSTQADITAALRDSARVRLDGTHQRCELARITIKTAIDLGAPPRSSGLDAMRRNLRDCRVLERKAQKEVDESR